MPYATRAVAAALLPLLGGIGCARSIYVTAERVASAPDGRAWVAGSEGFAAFSAGGALIRRDYPKNPSADAYEYEHYVVPAAQLVIFGGQTYLFTRPGEVFVDRGGFWKLAVRLPRSGSDHIQVDDVIAAPGERLLIRLHPGLLLFTTREGFERSAFEAEQAPEHNYFTWLGFFGDTLYALGFEGGDRRALQRREGPGRWATVSVLPQESLLGSLHGVVQLRGQQWMTAEDDRPERLAVVVGNGLVMIGPRGEPRIVPTEALLPAKAVRAAAMSRSPRRGDLIAAPADLKVAAPPDAPAAFQSPSSVMGLFTVPGSGPVLVIEGRAHRGARARRAGERVLSLHAHAVRGRRDTDPWRLPLRDPGCGGGRGQRRRLPADPGAAHPRRGATGQGALIAFRGRRRSRRGRRRCSTSS